MRLELFTSFRTYRPHLTILNTNKTGAPASLGAVTEKNKGAVSELTLTEKVDATAIHHHFKQYFDKLVHAVCIHKLFAIL